MLVQFLIFLLFIPLFYVLIIRPQQLQRKAHQAVVAGLAVGDKVMTVGGLIGTLTDIGPELVRIDTGEGHELTFGRTFIRSLVPDDEGGDVAIDEATDDPHAHADARTEGLAS